MEELLPQDIEELLQELDEEYGTRESIPHEVEELFRVLQAGDLYLARRNAAEELGNVRTSSPRIVRALIAAYDSDSYPEVRRAAASAPSASATVTPTRDLMRPLDAGTARPYERPFAWIQILVLRFSSRIVHGNRYSTSQSPT